MSLFSFSGHETFSLRHGWLKKGVDGISKESSFFSPEEGMINLGVGKNMVQSIRYWCLATQIIQEDPEKRGKLVPSDLGKNIFLEGNLDPYLEDSATIWLLHWYLATNVNHATTWFWMFNHCNYSEFTKEKIAFEIQFWLERQGYKKTVSENTLKRDIDCFLRTYVVSRQTKGSVSEDSLDCPLTDLRLITELDDGKTYQFERGSKDSLPDEIFVYALEKFWRMKERPENIALSKMLSEVGSPARIFKLDENSVVHRLEKIEAISDGAIVYDETAGLKQIYRRREIDLTNLLENCYHKKLAKTGSAK
jgi:hypothetical protein